MTGVQTCALPICARDVAGDRTKARHYYVKLVDMAGAGDARPDLTQARAFLAANP